MALGAIGRGWSWFLDGLVEAWVWCDARRRRDSAWRVDLDRTGGSLLAPDGAVQGRLSPDGEAVRFDPPEAAARLRGIAVSVRVPESWLFRRDLDPVAAESAPFLDAFVQHQIERITPWRVGDVFYAVRHRPLPSDPGRLAVSIAVLPRRLVSPYLEPLTAAGPSRIRLIGPDGSGFAVDIGAEPARRHAVLRGRIGAAVTAMLLLFVTLTGWCLWSASSVRDEIEAQADVIRDRRAVLAAAGRRDHAGSDAEAALRDLRSARPKAVDIIESLSSALPDSAYISELAIGPDGIEVTGLSRAVADLVPALERSGAFKDVSFSAATTKAENGAGDRFHLAMKASPPAVQSASLPSGAAP